MTDTDDMTARIRPLVSELSNSLKQFQASGSKFRILKTVSFTTTKPAVDEPKPPSPSASPKTLLILDSSFNPPTLAHHHLATSALAATNAAAQHPKPLRLLLLFATMNADKAPSAATFAQRLALMTVFATDLLSTSTPDNHPLPDVDIGVTTVPYYTDKSLAITSEGAQSYPDSPKHIHLIGFDTLTRFFNPKYYASFHPPLSALEPYFSSGHRLRVTLRPDEDYGTIGSQRAFLKRLADGEMEDEGGKREWAQQVELVDPHPEAGVSSTRVRRAAKAGQWEEVGRLCTKGVAEWVRGEELYEDDDRGAKMA